MQKSEPTEKEHTIQKPIHHGGKKYESKFKTTRRDRRRNTHGCEVAKAQLLHRNTSVRGHLDARRRTEDRQVLDGA